MASEKWLNNTGLSYLVTKIKDLLSSHTSDSDIHVSDTDRTTWGGALYPSLPTTVLASGADADDYTTDGQYTTSGLDLTTLTNFAQNSVGFELVVMHTVSAKRGVQIMTTSTGVIYVRAFNSANSKGAFYGQSWKQLADAADVASHQQLYSGTDTAATSVTLSADNTNFDYLTVTIYYGLNNPFPTTLTIGNQNTSAYHRIALADGPYPNQGGTAIVGYTTGLIQLSGTTLSLTVAAYALRAEKTTISAVDASSATCYIAEVWGHKY